MTVDQGRGEQVAGFGERRMQRECGSCHVCCTMLGVWALGKAAGQPCQHETAGGCAIHADRPAVCRDWYCLWLRDRRGLLSDADRPDRVGLIITAERRLRQGKGNALVAIEARPAAGLSQPARNLLHRLRAFVPVRLVHYTGQAARPTIRVKPDSVRRFIDSPPSRRAQPSAPSRRPG